MKLLLFPLQIWYKHIFIPCFSPKFEKGSTFSEEELLKNLFNIRKGRKTQISAENLHWSIKQKPKKKSLKDLPELPTRIQSSPRFGGQDSLVLHQNHPEVIFWNINSQVPSLLLNPLLLHHLVHIHPWNANTRDIGMVCL